MPYFLRGKCVWKGTKKDPIKEVKCHETRKKALAHLAALYVHVVDAKKESIITAYKEEVDGEWIDRWVTISTTELWDRQEQLFTVKAMDYDIARAARTGNYPELRLFHIRGFKLGVCDSMQRIKEWAVEQGYWLKTPLAQAMKEIIEKNEGKWKVSRGFYPVEAAGLCPECDAGLTVGLWNHILGVRCPTCKEYHTEVSELNRLKYFKTITFDLSLTDVPVTPGTAVTAYSLKTKQEKE